MSESNDRPRADGNNRRASLHSALWFLRDGRPRSTPELAALLNVTPSTALRLTQTLHTAGLVSEAAQVSSGAAGRPAKSWQLRAEAGHVLGLSAFPEEIIAIVTDLGGRLLARRVLPAETGFNAVNLPWGVREVAQATMADAGIASVLGAGVAMPGMIDSDEGIVRVGWHFRWSGSHVYDYPLRDALEQALECPVALDNDANACATAVFQHHLADGVVGSDDSLVYWLGLPRSPAWHGGLGLIIGGQPYRGRQYAVGELFHNLPPLSPEPCPESLCVRAMEGDQEAARAFLRAMRPTVAFMLGLAVPLDPQLIVFGGSWTVLGDAISRLLSEEMGAFRVTHEHIVAVACPTAALDPLWPNTIELGAARTILDKLFLAEHATLEHVLLPRALSA